MSLNMTVHILSFNSGGLMLMTWLPFQKPTYPTPMTLHKTLNSNDSMERAHVLQREYMAAASLHMYELTVHYSANKEKKEGNCVWIRKGKWMKSLFVVCYVYTIFFYKLYNFPALKVSCNMFINHGPTDQPWNLKNVFRHLWTWSCRQSSICAMSTQGTCSCSNTLTYMIKYIYFRK